MTQDQISQAITEHLKRMQSYNPNIAFVSMKSPEVNTTLEPSLDDMRKAFEDLRVEVNNKIDQELQTLDELEKKEQPSFRIDITHNDGKIYGKSGNYTIDEAYEFIDFLGLENLVSLTITKL